MDWYYVEDGKRNGPVPQDEFERLVGTGKVQGDTLVWREGMSNWIPYRETNPTVPPISSSASSTSATQSGASGEVVCVQCKGIFPKENTIQYGTAYVCANCKPTFVQKLREGAETPQVLNYAGFWIRFGAKLIDSLIYMILALPIFGFVVYTALKSGPGPPQGSTFLAEIGMQILVNLAFAVLSVAYNTFFHGKYGATLGKMACGLKVVSPEGSRISYGRALGRGLAELLSGWVCYIGYIIAAFDEQKRTLHDHIASTRVIRTR